MTLSGKRTFAFCLGLIFGVRPLSIARAAASFWIFAALICAVQPASAQFSQQGPKIVGAGYSNVPNVREGIAVAVSADGNTAIIGGYLDDNNVGAVWIFARSGDVWMQQGPKLVGTGAIGSATQGSSVALSADGNTAIVGGSLDNESREGGSVGAAWVFTRSNGAWTQQAKLIGTGYVANGAAEGSSVVLSADGNTAIVGGPGDNGDVGAVWVFTRSGGVWTQQGSKLVGNDWDSGLIIPGVQLGASSSLSADGNTALIGGPNDNNGIGATWVFTRSGGVWTQQGPKLVGTGYVTTPQGVSEGASVSLSADGNTAVIGGFRDNSYSGAAWIFTRYNGGWTQQGTKLVGTGAVGNADQGSSVAVSANGNTVMVGGGADNSSAGAVWVFTRTNFTWSQSGTKLVGTGAVGSAAMGSSIALSSKGTIAIVGGPSDNIGIGAAWVFAAPNYDTAATHDFNGDGYSDILWADTSGDLAIWEVNGTSILNENTAGLGNVPTVWSIVGQRDFNGDGNADILWRDNSGNLSIWEMNGTTILNPSNSGLGSVPTTWAIVGTGDFNGDGYADILWRDNSGNLAIWEMNGTTILNANTAGLGNVPLNWTVVGVADFNGDGMADILWRNNNNGNVAIWLMNGTTLTNSSTATFGNMPAGWFVAGTGDFNGDGMSDILWRDGSGDLAIWEMNGTTILNPNTSGVGNLSAAWSVAETGDFDGDGKSDILWSDTGGDIAIWFMNGTTITSNPSLGTMPTSWIIQGVNAD